MRPTAPSPPIPPRGGGGRPFAESMPRQALALGAWAGFWMAAERGLRAAGLGERQAFLAFLAFLAALGCAGVLGARGWLFRLFTSVRFAVTQGLFLAGAALLGLAGAGDLPGRLWFCALLAVLAAAMLTITWKRRPYPPSRVGFLLVHTAPSLILLGALWTRLGGIPARAGPLLVQAGFAALLAGIAWMFYLKPALKRREAPRGRRGPGGPPEASP